MFDAGPSQPSTNAVTEPFFRPGSSCANVDGAVAGALTDLRRGGLAGVGDLVR